VSDAQVPAVPKINFWLMVNILQVQNFRDNLDEGNDGFALGLKKLEELRGKRETMARKLEFSKFSLEDSERQAKKAEDLLEDAGLEMWKAEADIGVVR
jgi:hypothetical protein